MGVEISAATIHKGIHDARPDATCVFHLHPPYGTAIGQSFILSVSFSQLFYLTECI